jgi:anti-sigma regulatory factor (Ser/Thr protein kinase)
VRYRLCRTISAAYDPIEAVAKELRQGLEASCSRVDSFAVELLFREALTNAVVHGCRLDPTKSVKVAVRVYPNRIVLACTDSGNGFNWREAGEVDFTSDGEYAEGGRGISLYRAYASRIRFNASGNCVVLVRPLKPSCPEV